MQKVPFAAYILLLTVGWMHVYGVARSALIKPGGDGHQTAALRRQVRDLRAERALEREARLEFQQNVATLMPDALKTLGRGREGYPVRALASVVTKPVVDDSTRAVIARTLFERGKTLFDQKRYADANHAFEQVTERYSYTSYVTESYFLLAEGLYQINELERAVTTINHMVQLFPSDEMTGFAMVRLGRIYQERRKPEQAIELYRLVMRTFPQAEVAHQAKENLREVEL